MDCSSEHLPAYHIIRIIMTMHWIYILIAFSISLVFSLIGTPFIVKLCNERGILDQPNARKVHKNAVPRMGGILFMPSMGVGAAITLAIIYGGLHQDFEITISTIMMCIGALLIYVIGFLDDLNGMKAIHKFIIQSIAALLFPLCNLMITNLHGLFGIYDIPIWISYPLTVFVILLIVNAMNLIDGIDGLSSGFAILILSTFAILFNGLGSQIFTLICAGLTGAVLAFFFYNMFGNVGGNKVFMGDSGSLFLGYVIAYLAIKYQMSDHRGFSYREYSLLISVTLVLIPCLDVIRVAIQRKLNGKNMFDADKTHIHHLLLKMGLSMHQTLFVILIVFVAIACINYGTYIAGLNQTYIIISDIAIYAIFIWCVNNFRTA